MIKVSVLIVLFFWPHWQNSFRRHRDNACNKRRGDGINRPLTTSVLFKTFTQVFLETLLARIFNSLESTWSLLIVVLPQSWFWICWGSPYYRIQTPVLAGVCGIHTRVCVAQNLVVFCPSGRAPSEWCLNSAWLRPAKRLPSCSHQLPAQPALTDSTSSFSGCLLFFIPAFTHNLAHRQVDWLTGSSTGRHGRSAATHLQSRQYTHSYTYSIWFLFSSYSCLTLLGHSWWEPSPSHWSSIVSVHLGSKQSFMKVWIILVVILDCYV